MRRQITQYAALTLTLLGTLAVGARAQEREPAPERQRTFTFTMGPEALQMDLRRGRMGINVDLRADAARDSIGARVAGVTPGGPADRAGVQTGDLVTRVNGTRLAVSGSEDDEFQSRPAERLLRIASRLEPGDTVRLDVRRGAQTLQLTFVAEATDMDRVVERMRIPMMREFQGPMMEPGEPRMRVFAFGGGPRDLELVAVNPGLGDYFGTTEGLLVVDVGADTSFGLRAGDVILQIGGRRPQSPAHAMRILSTYEAGEDVRFDIMRQKRRASVNGRTPRRPEATWRVEPNHFEMRIPPMDLEPLLRMQEPMHLERTLPRMRWHSGTPEIQHEEAPKSLLRTDGWT
jgi:hypothetical protein